MRRPSRPLLTPEAELGSQRTRAVVADDEVDEGLDERPDRSHRSAQHVPLAHRKALPHVDRREDARLQFEVDRMPGLQ